MARSPRTAPRSNRLPPSLPDTLAQSALTDARRRWEDVVSIRFAVVDIKLDKASGQYGFQIFPATTLAQAEQMLDERPRHLGKDQPASFILHLQSGVLLRVLQ